MKTTYSSGLSFYCFNFQLLHGDFMKKYVTLKENREFQKLYHKGKSFVSPVLVTYVLKNRNNNLRFGITTGKKVGKAVLRSRARRVIRAAYFELYDDLNNGFDFVFVARGKTPFVKSTQIKKAMQEHFKKAGVLKNQQK